MSDDDEARRLRDDGIRRAISHAGLTWAVAASRVFEAYIRDHRLFMTEDVRRYAEALGLAEPPDARAWGHIAVVFRRAGRITPDHYEKSRNPKAHVRPTAVWRVVR